MIGKVYLEDGTVYEGKGFGNIGTQVGELIFSTVMIGYQSIMEDPSNAGSIVNMTYPWVGNYGIMKREKNTPVYARGLIVKSINNDYSNYKSIKSLNEYMEENNIIGVAEVDTRSIMRKIRKEGRMKCIITNIELEESKVKDLFNYEEDRFQLLKEASIKEKQIIDGDNLNIGVLDLGDRINLINILKSKGYKVTVFPYNSSMDEISRENIDGLIITNGPSHIEVMEEVIDNIKEIGKTYPIMGVELGHEIIAKSFGAKVEKMKYGHRGNNHSVYDISKERAYIVPQNHRYVIDKESLKNTELEVTHFNLNDETIEGIKHKRLKINAIQFKLERKTDLENTSYILENFLDSLKEEI